MNVATGLSDEFFFPWHGICTSAPCDRVSSFGLEHTVYKERLREVYLFGLYQIRVGKDIIAVFSNLVGGWGEEGVRLFSQVHSDRLRSNRDKLQHR